MGSDRFDMTAAVEAAWAEFRGRLADALAALGDGVISITIESAVDPATLTGASPYVQFVSGRGGLVCAEVSSNYYLDAHYALAAEEEDLLTGLGWGRPVIPPDDETGEPDSPANFHLAVEPREVDRVAVMAVQALREVFGCPHPVFLRVVGFRTAEAERQEREAREAGKPRPAPSSLAKGEDRDPVVVFPRNAAELQAAVDQALASIFEEPLRHDEDGDIPVAEDDTVIFVRVAPDRPAVDLHCELVVQIGDLERAAEEVTILNRSHPMARFHLHDDRIVARYRVHCWPFTSTQLVFALHQMQDRLDDLARDTAARVRGLTFVAAGRHSAEPVEGAGDDGFSLEEFLEGHCDTLGALLELMHEGPVPPPLVASLFDNNPLEIAHRLRMVRSGVTQHGEHDHEEVVAHLRAGLRFLAEHRALKPRRPLPPKPGRSRTFPAREEPPSPEASWPVGPEEAA